MPRTLGVEEEFHVVDRKTRRLTARAPELLDELSDSYVAELQFCVVEMNSGVVDTLDGLRVGVITDAGMVYFDVRPALAAPTLELRVCDNCPSVDTIVLIAGVFRALVEREVEALRAGVPSVEVAPPLGRAALWRAARSGLEGELVDISGPSSRPAAEVVTDLVRSLRPQLETAGDWPMIVELTRRVLIDGTSATRQRRAMRCRGRLTDVVDQLLLETAGRAGVSTVQRRRSDAEFDAAWLGCTPVSPVPPGPQVRNGVHCRVPQQLRGGAMKIDIADADVREPLQQTIEVSAAAKDQDDVMARLRDRFGVGDH